LVVFCLWQGPSAYAQTGQSDYSNAKRLANRVEALNKAYPKWVKTRSLVKTLGGKDIWMIALGSGALETKPGIAIVGGVDGTHLLGVELAIGLAEKLLAQTSDPTVQDLLEMQTIYVFPNM